MNPARLSRAAGRLWATGRRFGAAAAGRQAADRLLKAARRERRVEAVRLELTATSAESPDGFTARFLTPGEVAAFAADPANDLDPDAAARARRGDRCFGVLDGDALAASGWYALEVAEPRHCFGFGMRLPADAAYMYKGFTHPDYRGRRLHGYVMSLALRGLADEGVVRLVSTVDWTNAASLRSCWRLGYESLGRVVLRRGRVVRVPPPLTALGVEVFDAADATPRAPTVTDAPREVAARNAAAAASERREKAP